MNPAILVPFKADRRKSRLSSLLEAAQRRRLAELMLCDVLSAFRDAGVLQSCYVVSSDRAAIALATASGARTVSEARDAGVNSAVRAGMRALRSAKRFMVVPADLPLLSSADVSRALELSRDFDCVLSPSRAFDGTNLFAFPAERPPALSYDSNSFWNHVGSVSEEGFSLAVYCGRGVASDLDTPADLVRLSRSKGSPVSMEFAKEALAASRS